MGAVLPLSITGKGWLLEHLGVGKNAAEAAQKKDQ